MSDIELPPTFLDTLRGLIIQARQQASRSVNTIQVQTYWSLLASSDKDRLLAETQRVQAQTQTPKDFVRDPVMLEFLGLPETGRVLEADLERALMDKLQQFLLELTKWICMCGCTTIYAVVQTTTLL